MAKPLDSDVAEENVEEKLSVEKIENESPPPLIDPASEKLFKSLNLAPEYIPDRPSKTGNTQAEKQHPLSMERFLRDSNYRNIAIGIANGALHAVATVTNFVAKSNPALSFLNTIFDRAAIYTTKWVAPIASYGVASAEALVKDGKPLLAGVKAAPPAFLPLMSDANIDTVYGFSTALNQPYDLIENRLKAKAKKDSNFKAEFEKNMNDPLAQTGMIVKEGLQMVKDMFKPENRNWNHFWKEGIYLINCSMIMAGSLPIMLFARNDRDSKFAKVMGLIRNAGGMLGDLGFVCGERANPMKFLIGVMCSIAATADIAKRWVGEDVSRVLIHLGATLNVGAYALWNAYNANQAKKEEENSPVEAVQDASKLEEKPA